MAIGQFTCEGGELVYRPTCRNEGNGPNVGNLKRIFAYCLLRCNNIVCWSFLTSFGEMVFVFLSSLPIWPTAANLSGPKSKLIHVYMPSLINVLEYYSFYENAYQ